MPTEAREPTPERSLRREAPTFRLAGSQLGCNDVVAGRYLLTRPVRPGCRVWLAAAPGGQSVALKAGSTALIRREHDILRAMDHPHIVRTIDCIGAGADSVLVLEYLPGGDLVSLAGASPAHWLDAIAAVIDTLAWLHQRGIVHRDLKARNVMFDAAGQVRLIDFGSAAAVGDRWTAAGTTAATVDPSRGSGPVGAADDIYALAALLRELLQGAPDAAPQQLLELIECLPALSRFATVIESLLTEQRSHGG